MLSWNCQLPLEFRAESTDVEYAIDCMVKWFSKTVLFKNLKSYILNKEEIFYFR